MFLNVGVQNSKSNIVDARTKVVPNMTNNAYWHTLGLWLWRAVHAGVGGRHAPRRRDTRLIVDKGLLN